MFIDAFLYQKQYELLYIDDRILCCGKKNKPMSKTWIKIHKGVDNTVQFTVKNKDYKKVAVDHMMVKARLVNLENNEAVLEKYLTAGTCKGLLCLNVFEGDLCDIPAGYYRLTLVNEKPLVGNSMDTSINLPFYSDQGDNIFYDVEVTNQGRVVPTPSIDLNPSEWVPLNAKEEPYIVHSSAIPCNSLKNHKNSIHTFSVYATNFTGKLNVLGTLDPNPQTDIRQYFTMDIAPGVQDIEFDKYTGNVAFTVQCNLVWAKFKLTYTTDFPIDENGTIDRIVWRS